MKKKVLIITILALAVCLVFSFANQVMATDNVSDTKTETTVASLTSNGATKYYVSINAAIQAAKSGDVVKLEKDITVPDKNENGHVGFKGNTTITLDMNGFNITSKNASASTFYVEGDGSITVKNSQDKGGVIDHTGNKLAMLIKKGTVTLESGVTVKTTSGQTSQLGAIQMGYQEANPAKLILDGGVVDAEHCGITLFGGASSLEVKSGTITAKSFAISGNGSGTTNSVINITGGTVTSTKDAAIYHPQTGTLKISGGTVSGLFGVVARQGTVTVTGGTIVATGTVGQSMSVGDDPIELPLGSGIIVDNDGTGYEDRAKVTVIGSATFDTTGAPLVNFKNAENTDSAITVGTGPVFNKTVDEAYLVDGLIQAPNGKVMTEEDYEASLNYGDGTNDGDGEQPSESDGELDESPKAGVNDYTGILGAISSIALLGISVLRKRI